MKHPSRYSYLANLKLIVRGQLSMLQDQYPGTTDITLASRDFFDYNECITSCRQLMDDVAEKANKEQNADVKYVLSTEVNPIHTGQQTLSRDWSIGELARLWIFDEKMQGSNQIVAIGQARIFKTEAPSSEGITLN